MTTVVTIDLGTSGTKAALWSDRGLVTMGRAPLTTAHPQPGWAEQDPTSWWRSVVDACDEVRAVAPEAWADVSAVGFSAARETFTLVDAELAPVSPGILWSDQRAAMQATRLGDPAAIRARTGVVLDGAAHAAKVAWVAEHEPNQLDAARWILAPRDLVVACLTGEIVTDPTLASRTGFFELAGGWVPGAGALVGDRLPRVVPPATVIGGVRAQPGAELGLRAGTAVVLGAGDRACEVLGTGTTVSQPMVSWGSTTNVSIPHPGPVEELPQVAAVSRAAFSGFVVEAGVSASGAALAWLAALTDRTHDALLDVAATTEPGARGAIALPWLNGARAPWWQPDTHAAFLGLTGAHGSAELARAVIEGVAFDVARSIELLAPDAVGLALAGGGAANALWRAVLSATTELPCTRRRHDEAASVGARLIVGQALGESLDVERLSPVVEQGEPDAALVEVYRGIRRQSDAAAAAVLGLEES